MTNHTMGIDISKDKLDAFRLNDGAHQVFANNKQGLAALRTWIGAGPLDRVVYEATGAYHGLMERTFSGHLPLIKVNPLQAKRFAQSTGARAKTDRADAAMLAQMGAALQLEPDAPLPEDHHEISELQTARTGLIKAATQAKNQLAQQTIPMLRKMTCARIRQIKGQIAKLDTEIDAQIATCPKRARKVQILQSIPGVGAVLARTVLIEMPEIGTLTLLRSITLSENRIPLFGVME